jgi:hypothetical protein
MVATTFQDLLADAGRRNIVYDRTKESLTWFRQQSKRINITGPDLMRKFDKADFVNVSSIAVGKMYFYMYDPKLKQTLPYYDMFPCVFPIDAYSDGSFLGINLHYLAYAPRAKLLDALYDLENNARLPQNKRLEMSYGILKGATRYKLFQPCIKRYLSNHVRSKFLNVPHESWPIAAFLPVHDFQKASASKVWADSWSKIR